MLPSNEVSMPDKNSPKVSFRTMWMVPRNIRKIEPWKMVQISRILYNCDGDAGGQGIQDDLYAQLAHLGVKVKRNEENMSDNGGGMRTYFAQLACLGLFYRDANDKWLPTIAGEALMNGADPSSVLRCQLMRMQYPSVYGNGHNVKASPQMKVKPFAFLVRLLKDERLGCRLGPKEMAIPVIYGRSASDYEKCVSKILAWRDSGENEADLVENVDDVRTPRRCNWSDSAGDLKKGIEDALTIANTFKNYLQATGIVVPMENDFVLSSDESVLRDLDRFTKDSGQIEPAPVVGSEQQWQRRYGRYDRTKDTRTSVQSKRDGFSTLVTNEFIQTLTDNPFGVDLDAFVNSQSKRWSKPKADIERIISPILPRQKSIEREAVLQAAYSGGEESKRLELATTELFRRIGFDLSEHIGQKKAKNRSGGYPDVRIRASVLTECGFGDSKATSKYGFSINDTSKLGTYYKHCDQEFPDKTPSSYFVYIAGGFDRKTDIVEKHLGLCASNYGRPVSAITITALMDLAEMEGLPDAGKLAAAFASGKYFTSARLVLENAR